MLRIHWELVVVAWAVLFLSACALQPELPTRAVLAATLSFSSTLSPAGVVSNSDVVPVTWTVEPETTRGHDGNTGPLAPALPTRTPSVTPALPTRTPIPPTPTATSTATATATPYKSFIPDLPPTDELGPSKLGLHVIRNNDPAIMEFVRQAQPAVIKAVDDLGFLTEVKAASPRTITIGRIDGVNQSYAGNPEEAARRYVAENLAKYQSNPGIDYWEGWNEPAPGLQNMIWYSRFEQERVRQMALHGFRSAIGGFPTGVPELDEFMLFLPAIDVAIQHRGILSLHEYGAPDMTYLYGAALPGYPAYPDRGALKFRYRWYYREILEPAGMVIPLVISEAGIDGIIGNRPGPPGLGWQDFQDYWVQQGWGRNGIEAFIRQLAWYDAGVRQDGYVIGFTLFTAGGFGYWKNYDMNPILPDLTAYVVSQR